MQEQTNKVFLRGKIASPKRFSHEVYGEGFFETDLAVQRLSGQTDLIPITVSERLVQSVSFKEGDVVSVVGQFRSYNKIIEGKSKLFLTVFVREIVDIEDVKNPNTIVLSGFICKQPTIRTTPFGRDIADLLIAVNRSYGKSDYIPCIAWGRNAKFVDTLSVGDRVCIAGRIQSREYQKRLSDTEVKTLTAFEVSVNKIAISDGTDDFDIERELGLDKSEDAVLLDII